MKLLILIPCYNTHKYLRQLLSLIVSKTDITILLIDDGSSPPLSIDEFQDNNIILKRNDINKGKGHSIKLGFCYALDNNYTHVITLDGDMQHDPIDINKFINHDKDTDFLIGSRKFKRPMPYSRILSNTITSGIISMLVHKRINDSQCGYRRYKMSSISGFNFKENGYLLESEILLNCIDRNTTVHNIDIKLIYDGSPSYINKFDDSMRFVRLILRYLFA